MSEKREENLLQSIDSATGLKTHADTCEDGATITVTTKKTTIKMTFGKRFVIPLDFNFFLYILKNLKKDLIERPELSSSEKVILYIGDTVATYKLSDISIEYDGIFLTSLMEQRGWNNFDFIYQGTINLLSDTI